MRVTFSCLINQFRNIIRCLINISLLFSVSISFLGPAIIHLIKLCSISGAEYFSKLPSNFCGLALIVFLRIDLAVSKMFDRLSLAFSSAASIILFLSFVEHKFSDSVFRLDLMNSIYGIFSRMSCFSIFYDLDLYLHDCCLGRDLYKKYWYCLLMLRSVFSFLSNSHLTTFNSSISLIIREVSSISLLSVSQWVLFVFWHYVVHMVLYVIGNCICCITKSIQTNKKAFVINLFCHLKHFESFWFWFYLMQNTTFFPANDTHTRIVRSNCRS